MNVFSHCCTAIALLATVTVAQAQMPGPPPMGPPAFLRELFVPEQIMRYQDELALTPAQRDAITREMGDTQKQLVDLQWQFESASKKLADMLKGPAIDEAAAMSQADKVMNLELQMKRTHLQLLIRIKNLLTPAQQAKLRDLADKEPQRPGPPGPPH